MRKSVKMQIKYNYTCIYFMDKIIMIPLNMDTESDTCSIQNIYKPQYTLGDRDKSIIQIEKQIKEKKKLLKLGREGQQFCQCLLVLHLLFIMVINSYQLRLQKKWLGKSLVRFLQLVLTTGMVRIKKRKENRCKENNE